MPETLVQTTPIKHFMGDLHRGGLMSCEEELVQVEYGVHDAATAEQMGESFQPGWTYRAGGLELAVGDLVEVPPTARDRYQGDPKVATVIKLESNYTGPTHQIIRKHRHRYVPQPRLCRCGKAHA